MKGRLAGALCVVLGLGLTAFVWYSVLTRGSYGLKMAVAGPIVFALGVCFLIHARNAPNRHAVTLLRVYGIGGTALALAQLWLFGFFDRGRAVEIGLAVFLLGIWFLPAKFFQRMGGEFGPAPQPATAAPSATNPRSQQVVTPPPIEPR